ncbi:hypothetical protein Syun_023160 [Stephania yunnanensis]|uniref:NAD-dependent epimerase/dehydratase domain-containing protein n=1 Tax=Stephania yunnanensis TaxID=152371 RepID=A0AAP0F940_9MAGN
MAIMARSLRSHYSLSRLCMAAQFRKGRLVSTGSNKVDESFKVEEAETVNVPPPLSEKLLVLGGNGFVGSHICKEALDRGLTVASLSRSGRTRIKDSWASKVIWHQGNLLSPDSCRDALNGATSVAGNHCGARAIPILTLPRTLPCGGQKAGIPRSIGVEHCGPRGFLALLATLDNLEVIAVPDFCEGESGQDGAFQWFVVCAMEKVENMVPFMVVPIENFKSFTSLLLLLEVSCVGGFGSNSYMYKINGTANINAIRAAAEQGVKRFVYISAADFGLVNYLLQGYYEGKKAAETELLTRYPYGGIILRPGFIYGTRAVGSMKLPLGVIGAPLEMVLQHAKPLNRVPLVGPLLTPPVNVTALAKVAVRAATDSVFPPGIVDVYGILRHSQ